MELILGIDNFGEVISHDLNFIDKSLFIKEILDRKVVHAAVIIRPRRFGKTFNLSMLQHFFSAEVNGLKTQGMFDDLKIAHAGESYMQEQGKYPVIFISFKSIKDHTFENAYEQLLILLAETYQEHRYLIDSEALAEEDRVLFLKVLNREVEAPLLGNALKQLTRWLYLHYGVKPWLLIDEYDTPIQSAYLNDYYDPMIELMRSIFGNALKGNPNLHRAVITGILRIAKENLFSGVNNLKVFSVLNTEYAEHFGFTENEMDGVLEEAGLTDLSSDVKSWYNGYNIGHRKIYNPWSIANCVNEKGALKPYWVNTSDNGLIKQVMARASGTVKRQFEQLLQGEIILAPIDETMVFADLSRSEVLWSLLLSAGYVTPTETTLYDGEILARLTTPNREIASLYRMIVRQWFNLTPWQSERGILLDSLVSGQLEDFVKQLQKFLVESASHFDVKGTEPERFYHGFVMGLIVGLAETHEVHSNKESGYGRYDVMIIPKDKTQLGLVIEFKVADDAETLQAAAKEALVQIEAKNYAAQLQQAGVQQILKLGLSFYGKQVALLSA